jgi:hypothetical protein
LHFSSIGLQLFMSRSFYDRNTSGLPEKDVLVFRTFTSVVGRYFSRQQKLRQRWFGHVELLTMWMDENVFTKKLSPEDQQARLRDVMDVVTCVVEKDRFCELYAESLKNRLFFAKSRNGDGTNWQIRLSNDVKCPSPNLLIQHFECYTLIIPTHPLRCISIRSAPCSVDCSNK